MVEEKLGTFLAACGAGGPLELCVADAAGVEIGRWSLPRPFAVIGRAPKVEVRLEHEQISRRHVYLQVLAGRVLCLDLESRAGLTWDSVHEPSGWLGPDSVLGVGPYRIRLAGARGIVDGEPSLPSPLAARTFWPDAALPEVALDVPTGPDGPRRHDLRRVITLVGRTRDCRLRVHDGSVSRHHCTLLRTPGGLFVVDLLSREGTWVNGARVRWSRLDEGDLIEIGRFRAQVVAGGPSMLPAVRVARSLPPIVTRPAAPTELVRVGVGDSAVESLLQPLVAQFGRMQEHMFDQFHQSLMTTLQLVGTLHRDQMAQVRQELDRIGQVTEQLQAMQAEAARTAAAGSKPDPQAGPSPIQEATDFQSTPRRPPLRRRSADTAPDPDIHELICRRVAELQDERQGRWQALLSLLKGKDPKFSPDATPAQA